MTSHKDSFTVGPVAVCVVDSHGQLYEVRFNVKSVLPRTLNGGVTRSEDYRWDLHSNGIGVPRSVLTI